MSLPKALDSKSALAEPELDLASLSSLAHPKRSPWIWALFACILLGTSGAVRAVQDRSHAEERNYVEVTPFPLKTLPSTLGVWRVIPGGEQTLDDQTMQITGGTDYVLRTYVDDLTGVSLTVLVLFGPAEPVLPHTPQICFPASGYAAHGDTSDRQVKTEDGLKAQFRSAVYAKSGGRAMLREIAYHSFRLDGIWSPSIGEGRKFPRRNPGIFKVQVQRRVAEGERSDRNDPIEQFLTVLIPEIERKIAAGPAKGKAAPVAKDVAAKLP